MVLVRRIKHRWTLPATLVCVIGGSLGAGCGAASDEDTQIDAKEAIRISESATQDNRAVLDELARDEPDTDKIRRGTVIDYDDSVVNGLVELRRTGGGCTAQVINRWFLLTAAHCVDLLAERNSMAWRCASPIAPAALSSSTATRRSVGSSRTGFEAGTTPA